MTKKRGSRSENHTNSPPTQSLSNEVQLVHVGLPGPERNPGEQLSEDAAHRPHVDGGAVLGVPHQQLRGPVPARRHVVCVVVTRAG